MPFLDSSIWATKIFAVKYTSTDLKDRATEIQSGNEVGLSIFDDHETIGLKAWGFPIILISDLFARRGF